MPRDAIEDDDRPIGEKTTEEITNALYGSTDPMVTHAQAARIISTVAVQDFLNSPIQAEQVAAEWAGTFAEYKLNADESGMLAQLGVDNTLNPPTQEVQEQWAEASLADLQRDWGADRAGQALNDARMYVARTPGAADLIDRLGIGNHPKVVALCAARGRAMRTSGRRS